jgi:YjbR
VSGPPEIPKGILERVHALCLALPEVTVRVDESLAATRSTAFAFDIRRRPFCLLVAKADLPLIVLRAERGEREALLHVGRPFFAPRGGRRDRIGVLLGEDTDWEEIRELVTDSYRMLAPKKLSALLD